MQLFDKQFFVLFFVLPWTAKTAKRDGILAPNITYTQLTDPEKIGSNLKGWVSSTHSNKLLQSDFLLSLLLAPA